MYIYIYIYIYILSHLRSKGSTSIFLIHISLWSGIYHDIRMYP